MHQCEICSNLNSADNYHDDRLSLTEQSHHDNDILMNDDENINR